MSLRLFLAVHHVGTQPQCSSTERQHGREDLSSFWRGGKTLAEIGSRCGSKEHQTPMANQCTSFFTLSILSNQQDSSPSCGFHFCWKRQCLLRVDVDTFPSYIRTNDFTTASRPMKKSIVTLWHVSWQDDILGATLTVREATWIQPQSCRIRSSPGHCKSKHCEKCVCFRLSTWCLYARL